MLEGDGMFGNPLWVDRLQQRNEDRQGQWEKDNLWPLVEALPYSCIPTEGDAQELIKHLLATGWEPPWQQS